MQKYDEAAQLLVSARRQRRPIERLPESCRPATGEDALEIQSAVAQAMGESIAGWKCSLPRGENLFLAPLLGSTVHRDSPCRIVPVDRMAQIEPEIAFVLKRDLDAREAPLGEADVIAAIGETRFVLELIGNRYRDHNAVTFPEFLADSINNQGLFVGPALKTGLGSELVSFKIEVAGGGQTIITRDGGHPNGHPLRPIVWLANFVGSRGEKLRAGQIVTTGSYAGILDVPLATPLTVTFGALGSLSVAFAPAYA